jgi:DNA-binding CsgD family transcriptional regulator
VLTSGAASVRVEVASTVVRLALLYVARDGGWGVCEHEGRCGCRRVSDRLPVGPDCLDVAVANPEPASCQAAIEATLAGQVRAVVLASEPEDLTAACAGLAEGLTVIPTRVIELGSLAPKLTERQRATLRLLAKGASSTTIARALRQSESTAKRDIAELLQLFDVPNRAALVSSAAALGFVPGPPVRALEGAAPA